MTSKNSSLPGTVLPYTRPHGSSHVERTHGRRYLVYRACHHASKWKLECAPKVGRAERDDVEWEHVEFTRAHWVTLRDVLWRKYQRKRCPWRFIEAIDKLLEDMPEEEETGSPHGEDGR